MTADTRGPLLIRLARNAIAAELALPQQPEDDGAAWLQQPAATFITLRQERHLRGCMGSLQAHRSLLLDVRTNAQAAAFRDMRFAPLRAAEFAGIRLEVSLLSAQEPLVFASEADALQQLRPGLDGVVLEYGLHRGTFLPQVWQQLKDRRQFLAHLKQKAGLPAHFWSDDIQLARYTVTKWQEARKLPADGAF